MPLTLRWLAPLIVLIIGAVVGYFGRPWIEARPDSPHSPVNSQSAEDLSPIPAKSEVADPADLVDPLPSPEVSPETPRLPRVYGRVVCSDPAYLETLRVVCFRSKGYGAPGQPLDSGYFWFEVPKGSASIMLWVENQRLEEKQIYVSEDMWVEFSVEPPEPKQQLAITVLDPSGETLDGASFTFFYQGGGWRGGYVTSERMARRGRSGVYLRYLPLEEWQIASGKSKARCSLLVEHPTYGWQFTSIERGPVPTATVQFEEPARLDVRVDQFSGRSLEGLIKVALVRSAPFQGGRPVVREAEVDVEGRASFEGIPTGRYELVLVANSNLWMAGEVALGRIPIQVRVGENTAQFTCPDLQPLHIQVAESPAGWTLGIRPIETGGSFHATPSPRGDLVIDHLPPGEYDLWWHGPQGDGDRTIRHPGPKVVLP